MEFEGVHERDERLKRMAHIQPVHNPSTECNPSLTEVVSATHFPVSAPPSPASVLCSTVAGTPTLRRWRAAGWSILYRRMNPSKPEDESSSGPMSLIRDLY